MLDLAATTNAETLLEGALHWARLARLRHCAGHGCRTGHRDWTHVRCDVVVSYTSALRDMERALDDISYAWHRLDDVGSTTGT